MKLQLPPEYVAVLRVSTVRKIAAECRISKNTASAIRSSEFVGELKLAALNRLFVRYDLDPLMWEDLATHQLTMGREGATKPHGMPRSIAGDPIVAVTPAQRPRLQLGEELEQLAQLTARCGRGSQPAPKHPVPNRGGENEADLESRCDRLRTVARMSGEFEIAQSAVILKGCLRIKSSFAANFARPASDQSIELAGQLADIHAHPANPALADAALWTHARLLRELTLLADDPATRVWLYERAAAAMGNVRGGARLTFALPLPGLASEMNREAMVWSDPAKQDAMTTLVPVPYRYQAVNYMNTAYERHLVNPGNRRGVQDYLSRARRCVYQGERLTGSKQQAYWNLKGAGIGIDAITFVISTHDNGLRPQLAYSSMDAVEKAKEVEKLMRRLSETEALSVGAKKQYTTDLLCSHMLFSGGRREPVLFEKILPLVRFSCQSLPRIRSMEPQECLKHHLFMRRPASRRDFLQACGFTEYEIMTYQQRMTGGWDHGLSR